MNTTIQMYCLVLEALKFVNVSCVFNASVFCISKIKDYIDTATEIGLS